MTSSTTSWLTHRFRSLVVPLRSARKPRPSRVCMEALETRELLSGDIAWNFVSAPQLHPATVTVLENQPQAHPALGALHARHPQLRLGRLRAAAANPGLIFLDPYQFGRVNGAPPQPGVLMIDTSGNPVWFRPADAPHTNFDFKQQTFQGKPVLTWWEGSAATGGVGGLPLGTAMPGARYVIYNNHYQQIRTVTAKNGFNADLHDFQITSKGIGVVIGTKVENADLTAFGGPQDGTFLDAEIQGINLRTSRLAWSWDLATHIPLAESYLPASPTAGIVWDPYHVNSVDVSQDGKQLLVSVRHTSAVYDVNIKTGQINWQLGGKHPTLHVDSNLVDGPDNSAFQYQHDARFVPGGISLFDNGGIIPGANSGPFGEGRGMVFSINTVTATASLQGPAFEHTPELFPNSQGNMQSLANGDKFIGWGAEPTTSGTAQSYFSEFAANGTQTYDAVLPDNIISYRAYRFPWVGQPLTKPSVAITDDGGGQKTVFASWNGSTMTTGWRLLAGHVPGRLVPVVRFTPRSGFETAINTIAAGPFYQVQALGARGAVLKSSPVIHV